MSEPTPAQKAVGDFAPQLVSLTDDVLFGQVWSRDQAMTHPTELPTHITHEATNSAINEMYAQATVTAEDVAEIIVFAVQRPAHLAINEILLRPATQA